MSFWKDKNVFITGHTGFKGSWLSIWLKKLGAKVTGFSLEPPTDPSLFELANIESRINSIVGDIRDLEALQNAMLASMPDVVFHMAAQPLVRLSYDEPVETFETNVMGTVNVLESIRNTSSVKSVVIITTDKCYENREWYWGYREDDPMGGFDPYSNSKGCAELVTASYRNSFFNSKQYGKTHSVAIASARAGNVIGGGDWARDRLVPDCIKAINSNEKVIIRNPQSIRPWQHVLEPLNGYITLAENLFKKNVDFAEAWNFGPKDDDAQPVGYIVGKICELWGDNANYRIYTPDDTPVHEATYLKLDCSKAKACLGWKPLWGLDRTIASIVAWNKGLNSGKDAFDLCIKDITEFEKEKSGI